MEAVAYAKSVLARPAILEEFTAIAAHKKIKSPLMAVMTDYLSNFKLQLISTEGFDGMVGFPFAIILKDNYRAKEMTVSISNKDGTIVESGNASFKFGDHAWIYTTTKAYTDTVGLKLTVTVKDRRANVATYEKVM